ncbi:MAG: hypothetical protein KDA93_07790 [Planctomycetaceae bacterium]|nr:hypothetical protein [Planctomycetaceae bacterium]
MDCRPFRFLHAADFRLDTPCFGVPNLPADLRRSFVDARYTAARRVFDTAIERNIDFVILAGGLLDSQLPGLRGPLFLIEQCSRLADRGIKVYWAGATFETQGRWPDYADVPSNLKLFAGDQTDRVHRQHGRPVARLIAVREFSTTPHDSDMFTIAIHPRCTRAITGVDARVDYWALGGQSERDTQTLDGDVAHFPGSPQGSTPNEQGPHGCSIVTVDANGRVSIEPVATDVVRWCHEELALSSMTSWDEMLQDFEQRLTGLREELAATSSVEMAIINWTATGGGLSMQRLLQPRFQEQLIRRLNERHQQQSPALWTLEIETVVDPHQLDDWQHEHSSLGAFLRELGQMSDSLCASHAPTPTPHLFNDALRKRVVNEGIHRLGKEPQPS